MSYSPVLHAALKEIKEQSELPFDQMHHVHPSAPRGVKFFVGPFQGPELDLLSESDLVEAAKHLEHCIYRATPQATGTCAQFFRLTSKGLALMALSDEEHIRFVTAKEDTIVSLLRISNGKPADADLNSLFARFWIRPSQRGIALTQAGRTIVSIIRDEHGCKPSISQLLTSPPEAHGSEKHVLKAHLDLISTQGLEPAVLAGLGNEIVAQLEEAGFRNDLGGGK